MRKTLTLLLFVTQVASVSVFAQEENTGGGSELPSLAFGTGILSFVGDVGGDENLSVLSKIRIGYNFSIEQRFLNGTFGLSLNALSGKLSGDNRSAESNLNFESKIFQADALLLFHLDNGFVMDREATAAPYLFGGFGYLKFNSYGDLRSSNGTPYHYWEDGSIKDRVETGTPADTNAVSLRRDYTYETQLKDSIEDYARTSFALPVGAGIKLKLTHNFDVNLAATYYLSMTDWIDNVNNGGTDHYFYSHVSFQYTFGKTNPNKPKKIKQDPTYENIDFAAIDNQDTDKDGIKDNVDRCPDTPKGISVDSYGCPKDSDGDGVPDYLDKEPNSKRGALVDLDGVTLTDEIIAQRYANRDSVQTVREQHFEEAPSMESLRKIEEDSQNSKADTYLGSSAIPAELRAADSNKDGYITVNEITETIDAFFEGETDFTVEKIGRLIDFFFEQ